MDTRADRFPLFDSLRAIAALAVITTHTGSFGGVAHAGDAVMPFLGPMAVAVPIFLAISGFLLYRPFVARRARDGRMPSAKAYAWRRVLRLVPAYWVALVVTAIWLGNNALFHLGEPPPDTFSARGLIVYFGFLQIYSAETRGGGIPQAWTIDTEAVFYALLPLFALATIWITRRYRLGWRADIVLLAGIVAASWLWKVVVVAADEGLATVPVTPLPLLSSYPAYADHLALGMALAVLSVWVADRDPKPRWVGVVDRRPWLPWLVAVAAFVLLAKGLGIEGTATERITPAQYFARHVLFGVIAVGLLLPAVFGDQTRGWVRRLLANRALLHFGMVSYGVYLFHLAWIIQLVHWDWGSRDFIHPWAVWLPPVVLGAWVMGSISYYVVERPALSLKRLIPEDRGSAPDQPGAVSAPAAPPSL